MKEDLINFETAKLAKEKGFDWKCNHYYETSGQLICFGGSEHSYTSIDKTLWPNTYLLTSTQSLLQKWLREEHNIEVFVHLRTYHVGWVVKVRDMKNTSTLFQNVYETYEDALENGLYEALLIIK